MTKICPYCAEEIKKEAIKCKYCHSMLGASDEVQQPLEKQNNVSNIPQNINYNNKQNFGSNLNYPLIFAIFIMIFIVLLFGGLIIKFWPNIVDSLTSSSKRIEVDISKTLKLEDKNFSINETDVDNVFSISYNYNELFKIDGEKILEACGENHTCYGDTAIALNPLAPYILEKDDSDSNRVFVISFVNKPTKDEILKARKEIFDNNTITFGDTIIIEITSSSNIPLTLTYEAPSLQFEVVNKTKTSKKYITLDLAPENLTDDELFSYEDNRSFFLKNEFDKILSEYLESIEFNEVNNIDYFKHISSVLDSNKSSKYSEKYYSFFINTSPVYPTISYGRKVDETSCLNWKEVATRNNTKVENDYANCLNSGSSSCKKGLLYMMDYGEYYLTKIPSYYPTLDSSEKIVNITSNGIGNISNSVCRSELNKIVTRIENTLLSK